MDERLVSSTALTVLMAEYEFDRRTSQSASAQIG